jgi:hypothetical protein
MTCPHDFVDITTKPEAAVGLFRAVVILAVPFSLLNFSPLHPLLPEPAFSPAVLPVKGLR